MFFYFLKYLELLLIFFLFGHGFRGINVALSVSDVERFDVISLYTHYRTSDHIRPLRYILVAIRSLYIPPFLSFFFLILHRFPPSFVSTIHGTQNTTDCAFREKKKRSYDKSHAAL